MQDELAKRRDAIETARMFEDVHSAIDGAIGSNAKLIAKLLDVRCAHMSGIAGQNELVQIVGGLTALTAAREQIITAHNATGELGRIFGLVVRSEGGANPKAPLPTGLEQEDQRQAA